ncbi:site-2 protease family protein [Botrimarina sp.]|uniref:site-2 protease family protein n=1 Tax=Botrimarina sp. TaxID=2795802 RepID=UPI0032ECE94C
MSHPRGNSSDGAVQARPDLVVTACAGGGATIKDPVSLEYFRLGPRELWVLRSLAAPTPVAELRRRFNERWSDEPISAGEALAVCATLSECGLLVQGSEARAEARPSRRRGRVSPFVIQLPGFDPTPLLDRLGGMGRALFSWPALWCVVAVGLLVAARLAGRVDTAAAELRGALESGDSRLAWAFVAALVLTKVWHELGHALACRRMGCECHDAGMVLLALTPCAYCDVSDAWMLASRRRRAVVALGGVYFEALVAIAAAAVWLVLQPGLSRTLALMTAVLASVSTLAVNLNPLVRFDGYYLLADLWGVPNLHEQSRRALWGGLRRWVSGATPIEEPLDAPRGWLAAYAALSTAYLAFVIALLLWAARQLAASVGLKALGDTVVVVLVAWLVIGLAAAAWRPVGAAPPGRRLGAGLRLASLVVLGGGAAAVLLGLRLEQTLLSPCRLQPARAAVLAAPFAGDLTSLVEYGQRVEAGAAVARVWDADREAHRMELREQLAATEARVAALERLSVSDHSLAVQSARETTRLAELRRQSATLDRLAGAGTLRAPLAGRVLPPPAESAGPAGPLSAGPLPRWTGAPLDAENVGCVVEAGEELGAVASDELRAVVLLDQQDSGLVGVGDPVRVALDRDPGTVLAGRVEAVALAASEHAAARPDASSDVALESALRDPLREGATYRVWVRLEESTPACQSGALGQARIVTGDESILGWLGRRARRLLWPGAAAG